MKDYSEASLAIISEIEPKDAIMQLLKQETYSRYPCSTSCFLPSYSSSSIQYCLIYIPISDFTELFHLGLNAMH